MSDVATLISGRPGTFYKFATYEKTHIPDQTKN